MDTDRFGIEGAPDHELARSPAAARVGHLAAASGLALNHFEHRVHLPPPDHWLPEGRADLGGAASGHLVEHKYAHHRNDDLLGSFNPGHRAKWTAHELCHGLAGFAWRPGATPFFHALSARLSEAVPVALWYFFDEAGLRRCPDHDGPLFGAFCPACEAAATLGPRPLTARDEAFLRDGLAFVDRELAAVERSRRLGRPVPHRYATLDLASDAMAYAASHHLRLASPEFHRYFELFHAGEGSGAQGDLDGLAHRVEQLAAALAGRGTVAPWPLDTATLRARDVGWRLLQVAAECEGEALDTLDSLVVLLATRPAAMEEVLTTYRAATEEWWLPPADEVFAVGGPGPLGRSAAGLLQAIADALPGTEAVVGDELGPLVDAFVQGEPPTRGPAPRRFARWLAEHAPGPAAELAGYEAACGFPAPADAAADSLGAAPGPKVRAEGVEVLRLSIDPEAFLSALDGRAEAEQVERPTCLAIRQRAGGEVVVAELSAETAEALAGEGPVQLPAEEEASLVELGIIRPARWPEVDTPDA
ncbi:MAG: hypothetical protein R3F43_31150 [bacterium]